MIYPVTDLKDPALDPFLRLSETELLRFHEPALGLFLAESPNVVMRALQAGYEPVSILTEPAQLDTVHSLLGLGRNIPVYVAEYAILKEITGFSMTRGLLAVMKRRPLLTLPELLTGASRLVILENVMNPTNLGAIFRSAAALGMDGILLTAGCTDPLYRRSSRVSMGTVFQIPWTFLEKESWPAATFDALQEAGFRTAAMALRDDTVTIDDKRLMQTEKLAVLLGTEGDGLATDTIHACDFTIKIPMSHNVDSLNVAAASAIAFWQLGHNSR